MRVHAEDPFGSAAHFCEIERCDPPLRWAQIRSGVKSIDWSETLGGSEAQLK
jgi:hypothetical protein